ncbi:MAG: DUF4981 domain-containing protein [Kiritimatiellae bacterium]|nr:DUF4981 domain-containing protein [Kiritimatiellia bacterium]
MKHNSWEIIDNFGLHRLPSRSVFDYTIKDGAPERQSLDGVWDFLHLDSPLAAPEDFMDTGFDACEWDKIAVPSCWQMEGFGHPHYTNVQYPIPIGAAPCVPTLNPTGLYRREFFCPQSWKNRSVRIRFDGVDSCFELWINGKFIGMGMGSRLPHEFDITKALDFEGANVAALRVVQWSAGTFLEDQDQWWMNGIFRSVTLLAAPSKASIEDIQADSALNGDFSVAELSVRVRLAGLKAAIAGATVEATLADPTGAAVFDAPLSATPDGDVALLRGEVRNPVLWNAESPALYRLTVSLKGVPLEMSATLRIGFRKVEIRDGVLLLNGQRLIFKGVDRHEFNTISGRTISLEAMRSDILTMKRHNINAVRTSHYPDDPRWYDLCDEFGIYLIDECDLETHGFGFNEGNITNNPDWEKACCDRMERMVSRDRNHPSVLIWSLGNESGFGCNHRKMAELARKLDPSRPIHYEGDYGVRTVDMYSRMYPSIQECLDILEGRGPSARILARGPNADVPASKYASMPFVLCEYAHAMGNGPGGIKEYWDLIWKYPRFCGAFVWEWKDHGVTTAIDPDDDGADAPSYYAYGGDFGEVPNDGSFICDGLLLSDGTPSPGLLELKQQIQPFSVERLESKGPVRFRITSRLAFTTSAAYTATWAVLADGEAIASGILPLPEIAPYSSAEVALPWTLPAADAERRELVATVSFALSCATPWAPAGHETGFSQFILRAAAPVPATPAPALTAFPATGDECDIHPSRSLSSRFRAWNGIDCSAIFDCATGRLDSWNVGGRELLLSGPEFNFWRSPTANEGKDIGGRDSEKRRKSSLHWLMPRADQPVAHKNGNDTALAVPMWISGYNQKCAIDAEMRYTVRADGTFALSISGKPVGTWESDWPRIGVTLRIPLDFHHARWYGRGPGETYPDTFAAGRFGVWSGDARKMWTSYAVPQESGSMMDTRWLTLADASGTGMRISADAPFTFSVSRFEQANVDKAKHPHELVAKNYLILNLDIAQAGIGSNSCGPELPPEYRIDPRPFSFTWVFTPAKS